MKPIKLELNNNYENRKLIRFALLAAVALSAHTVFAAKPPPPPPPPSPSSGTVVFNYANGSNSGLAAHPSGAICASGIGYNPDGDLTQMVWANGDLGSTWSLLDNYVPPGFSLDTGGPGGSIAADAAGNLYTTALAHDYVSQTAQPNHWFTRRSTDGGATWATVDDFIMKAAVFGSNVDDIGMAVDAAGDVYVSACDIYTINSVWHYDWTIRKGIGGTSFSTIDVLPDSYPKDIFVHPTAGIFVVGQANITIKNQPSWVWLVRRSTDGGATWSNVDTFQLSSSQRAVAMGVGADASGNLFVVGSAYKSGSYDHWVVRKSTNGGSSWTTVDDYQVAADNSSQARCIAKDASGNLVVAGVAGSPANGKWIVRKSAGGTGPWTTVDVQGGYPNAIAADAFGNVFVGGSGGGHWLIKRY